MTPSLTDGLLAGVMVLHGIAHLVGFIAPWRLIDMENLPYKTTVLGGTIDLGDRGIRLVGILWLIATIAFAASAIGLLTHATWWLGLALSSVALSLVLTLAEWPLTKIGVAVNVALLGILLSGMRFGWLPAT